MAKRREWDSLSETYRSRLARGGITREAYEAGAPLSEARGHAKTPEHPKDAYKPKNRERYVEYRKKAAELVEKAKERKRVRAIDVREAFMQRKMSLYGDRLRWHPIRAVEHVFRKVDSPDGLLKAPSVAWMRRMLNEPDEVWDRELMSATDLVNANVPVDDATALFYH